MSFGVGDSSHRRFAWRCALARRPPAPYKHSGSLIEASTADLTDPASAQYLPDSSTRSHGIRYANARAVTPSDNFPNVIAQFTGATPKTITAMPCRLSGARYFAGDVGIIEPLVLGRCAGELCDDVGESCRRG